MATASNSFDLKNIIDELVNFAKTRTADLQGKRPAAAASAEQLSIAILAALETAPKNAKQVGDSIALANGGSWVPSAAQIRLSLEQLIEQELVQVATKKDRKVYSLTKQGVQELAGASAKFAKTKQSTDAPSGTSSSMPWCDPQFLVAASKLGPVMLDIAQTGTRAQQQQATQLLEALRHELHKILAD